MKKFLSILIVAVLLVSLLSITASAAVDGTEYIAYGGGDQTPHWKAVYVPADNYSASAVQDCVWRADSWQATLPDNMAIGERIYMNSGDPTHIITAHNTQDIGLVFTAPEAGDYRLDFSGQIHPDMVTVCDGMVVKICDGTLAVKKELAIGAETTNLSETYTLAAGEKLYFFVNAGTTFSGDHMLVPTLKVTHVLPELSEAKFTPMDTTGVKVSNGAQYDQFFNVLNATDAIGLWTGFYVTKSNTIDYLVPDAAVPGTLALPSALRTGDNQWMVMWEGLNNATAPIGEYTIGDYFTVPASGTVNVNASFAYNTPAANGDGVTVTVYKNRISDDNVLIAQTLFNYDNSSDANTDNKGMAIKAENVSVKKGDVIIFVYGYNAHYYSDNLFIRAKNVTYTDVTYPSYIFNPDNTQVVANGQEISVLKGLTANEMIYSLGADAAIVAAYKADGTQILDFAATSAADVASLVYYNDAQAKCPIGVYSVTAVDTLPNQEVVEPTPEEPVNPGTGDNLLLVAAMALVSVCAASSMVIIRKKH